MIVLVAMIGIGTACVNTASSINFDLQATTTGASYYESVNLNLAKDDAFKFEQTLSMDTMGAMMTTGSLSLDDKGSLTSNLNFDQRLLYTKSIEYYVDPLMTNHVYTNGADVTGSWFMGSTLQGVQLGMDFTAKGGAYAYMSGLSTDMYFNPILMGSTSANNFAGSLNMKDKFTFDRDTQTAAGIIGFGYTQ
jgi:hypothetical protein